MDDVAQLGPAVADIAGEKAGLLSRTRGTAVVRAQDAEVALSSPRRADEVGATLMHEGRGLGGRGTTRSPSAGSPSRLRTPAGDLRGPVRTGLRRLRRRERRGRRWSRSRPLTEKGLNEEALREGPRRGPDARAARDRRAPAVGGARRRPQPGRCARRGPAASTRSFTWERLHLAIAVSANKDVAGVVAPLARARGPGARDAERQRPQRRSRRGGRGGTGPRATDVHVSPDRGRRAGRGPGRRGTRRRDPRHGVAVHGGRREARARLRLRRPRPAPTSRGTGRSRATSWPSPP